MPELVRCIHGFAVTSESGYCTACLISELQRQLAAANKRADEADMNNRMQLAFRMKTERQLAAANERADKAEVEIERLKKRSEGHDKPCFDCGRRTNDLSGDPGPWSIPLCHSDHPGVVQWHHAGCVSNRLAERERRRMREDSELLDMDMRGWAVLHRDPDEWQITGPPGSPINWYTGWQPSLRDALRAARGKA